MTHSLSHWLPHTQDWSACSTPSFRPSHNWNQKNKVHRKQWSPVFFRWSKDGKSILTWRPWSRLRDFFSPASFFTLAEYPWIKKYQQTSANDLTGSNFLLYLPMWLMWSNVSMTFHDPRLDQPALSSEATYESDMNKIDKSSGSSCDSTTLSLSVARL